jgi:hypothetical protein
MFVAILVHFAQFFAPKEIWQPRFQGAFVRAARVLPELGAVDGPQVAASSHLQRRRPEAVGRISGTSQKLPNLND